MLFWSWFHALFHLVPFENTCPVLSLFFRWVVNRQGLGFVGSGDVYFLAVAMGICEVIEDEAGNSKEKVLGVMGVLDEFGLSQCEW